MRHRIRRAILGRGRWAGPPVTALLAFFGILGAIVAGEALFYRWATAVQSPARTVAEAGRILRSSLRLDSALSVTWRRSLEDARAVSGSWDGLLVPPLPPAVCPAGDTTSLAATIRALDGAVDGRADPPELQRRIDALRASGPFPPHGVGEFLVRYNAGRGYLAAGDLGAAASITEPIFDGFFDDDRVPVVSQGGAARLMRNDRVSANEAALAFHARFLAGAIAYRRGDVNAAIAHFRLAINAVNYLIATPDSTGLGAPGNFQRIEVGLADYTCAGSEGDVITSLDAYAGLVAAYMAAPGFTDPSRLPPEVRRTRLQIDPDDPFRPVLRYASSVVARPSRSPIPENLLWAASNLQRIYHYNRLRPDPRLEVTRAVLLLQLTAQPTWVDAMSASGETDVCAMLGRVGQQLQQQASYRAISTSRALPTDSASAAVAIHTFARLETDCDRSREPPPADVRSVWLREGSNLAGGDIATHYEVLRTSVENGLRATNASTDVIAARVAPALEQAEAHRAILSSGRVPPDLPATLNAHAAADFVHDWWTALFYDIGDALANAGSELPAATPGAVRTTPAVRIQAGDAPALLSAMNSAIAHADLRPADFYAPQEFTRVARAGGRGDYIAYRIRYAVQSNRGGTIVGLAVVFLVLAFGALALHVSWWRYDLLVRRRLYHAESGRRGTASR